MDSDSTIATNSAPQVALVRMFTDGKWHAWCPVHDRHWVKPYYRPRVFKTQASAEKSAAAHDREYHNG